MKSRVTRHSANFSEALLPVKLLLIYLLTAVAESVAAASDFYVEIKPILPSLKAFLLAIMPAVSAGREVGEVVQVVFENVKDSSAKTGTLVDMLLKWLDLMSLGSDAEINQTKKKKSDLNGIMQSILDFGGTLGPLNGGGPAGKNASNEPMTLPMLQ